MERKFKGIALMLIAVFLVIITCSFLIMQMDFQVFIIGLLVSFVFLVIGLYYVFSEKETEKAIKDYIDGKDE